jgi:hypothetical protein
MSASSANQVVDNELQALHNASLYQLAGYRETEQKRAARPVFAQSEVNTCFYYSFVGVASGRRKGDKAPALKVTW